MNYYSAREIERDGKGTGLFHYTCLNDDRIWPVGYCGRFQACPDCDGRPRRLSTDPPDPNTCKTCGGTDCVELPPEKRCPGHATREEAQEHYRQYLLDQARFEGPKREEWPKEKCESTGCNDEATHLASVPGHMIHHQFCAKHCNREELAKKVTVGERVSSY